MSLSSDRLRNVAIIAHVDHGKTTLVDCLLRQSGTLEERGTSVERVMDSNDLERERGITILSKNTAIDWHGYRINIVDTPGHADFGGEVERVLSMVDAVLLLVDAVEGPMPQTRFVTRKAFEHGLPAIVVVNKVDRDRARPHWVVDRTFDLFDKLGANDDQLDFATLYTSAISGYASLDADHKGQDMTPLFQAIVDHVPPPDVDRDGPFQMRISTLDYSSYVGAIGIGRIQRGAINENTQVTVAGADGRSRNARVLNLYSLHGVSRRTVNTAAAGDIVAVSGIDELKISDTLCDPARVEPMRALTVDEPTVTMTFEVNTSPFSGREGKYLTSRQIHERLRRELIRNVALRVNETRDPEKFEVSGRGELHLSILLETMRREGYELAVSTPRVITRETAQGVEEPIERLVMDVEDVHQGAVMEMAGNRGGMLEDMAPDGAGRVRLEYLVPTRGLLGMQTEFMTATSGSGLMYRVFDHYGPRVSRSFDLRRNGVLISNATGRVSAYALFNLQERGRLLVSPGDEVYEGQVVGVHSRNNDLVVNPLKGKQLTNIRAAGKDDNILLAAPWRLTLERALEFIADDELVEITPGAIRIRKRFLIEHQRKRESRAAL